MLTNNSLSSRLRFEVYSSRRYGQPKLPKPKELKGISPSFIVLYIEKCACQCFVVDGDVWVKHRDWFSDCIYYSDPKRSKFVYNDHFGAIVLRDEAWIRITNVAEAIETTGILNTKEALLRSMADALNLDYLDLYVGDMERFFERVVVETKNYIERNK